ncbi:MAG: competence type IV pilus minor pilin ComGF [Bacillus sp. (in: firmicutes)]
MLLRREQGFTLIEMLFSLVAFIIMAALILQTLLVIEPAKQHAKSLNQMEWEMFLNNIKREVRKGSQTTVSKTKIYISENQELAIIEQYGNVLRRRVDFSGHQVLLHNVKSFAVSKSNQLIVIKIIDTRNQEFEAVLSVYNE